MADKSVDLRIFRDEAGRTNRSLVDVGGAMLVVSQFTLYGDTRKGRRPSFIDAAAPDLAAALVEVFAADRGEPRHRGRSRRVRGGDGGRPRQRRAHDHLARQRRLSMAGSPLLGRIRNRARARPPAPLARWRPIARRERHIVMGGAPRSGTTLLRRLLDRHPEICAGAETKLFVPAAFNLAWLAESYAIPLDELEAMRRAPHRRPASSMPSPPAPGPTRARPAGRRRRPRTSATWTGSWSTSRRPRSSMSSATAGMSSAPCVSTPTGAGWMAPGRRCWCRVRWTGTPSAGWRTRRPAWRGGGTADTWRSATRTSSPTPSRPCAPSASGSTSGSTHLARGGRQQGPRRVDGDG